MRLVSRGLYWVLTIPYVLVIAFFAVAIPYSAAEFFQGGLPGVKIWLIHIQTEGCLACMSLANDYWTWPHTLRPVLVSLVLAVGLWAARRVLQRHWPSGADTLTSK
jgi:hypothetical protein